MTDVLTRKQRSYCISQIHGENTQPELLLREAISKAGIRGYRLHYRLPGKPDIVFPKRKIAIFIDGCFWHKCPKCFPMLSTTKRYWVRKISNNVKRDKTVSKQLRDKGWKVVRLWEHDVRKKLNKCSYKLLKQLKYTT